LARALGLESPGELKPLSLLSGPYNREGSKETAALFGDGDVFSF
jgi:hypothetical protein